MTTDRARAAKVVRSFKVGDQVQLDFADAIEKVQAYGNTRAREAYAKAAEIAEQMGEGSKDDRFALAAVSIQNAILALIYTQENNP